MQPPEGVLGPGLVSRRLRVGDGDVVWLRSVVEAYDGLALLYGDGTGEVMLVAPEALAPELDALISALQTEAHVARLPD